MPPAVLPGAPHREAFRKVAFFTPNCAMAGTMSETEGELQVLSVLAGVAMSVARKQARHMLTIRQQSTNT